MGRVRILRALPALMLPVVVLSGCGVADTEFHPGVAVEVGDQTISVGRLDKISAGYCAALEKVTQQGAGQPTPMRALNDQFARDLVVKAAAEQLADEYEVTSSTAYHGTLARLEPQLDSLDDDEKDAVREVVGAQAYAQDVLLQIGEESLGNADATEDEKFAEGRKLLENWLAENDVRVNPKYAVDLGSGPVDTNLSVAVSDIATAGSQQEDPSYVSALSGRFVCLD